MSYAFFILLSILIATIISGLEPKQFWRLGTLFSLICNGIGICIATASNNGALNGNYLAAGAAGVVTYILTGLFWQKVGTAD